MKLCGNNTITGVAILVCTSFGVGEVSGAWWSFKQKPPEQQAIAKKKSPEVTPIEDLMREHGVLHRALLIYEAAIERLRRGKGMRPAILVDTATIIRNFIEDYHEKLEEEYIFPRFEKMGKKLELVKTLRKQHELGRRFTDYIRNMASTGKLKNPEKERLLIRALRHFIGMYRVHTSREDTELYPAFYALISKKEYKKLGEAFEERGHKLFGKDGFEKILEKITKIEKELDIHDPAKFLPKVKF